MQGRLTRTGPAPAVGIVHLGPGAFFRAFNAVYTHEAMAKEGGDWGICAVSLRSPTARDQLAPQGGVFTSVALAPEGANAQVIGSVVRVLVAPEDPGAVIDAMAEPCVKIVSLTITEKGYCHNPATGKLDPTHPDIVHDLREPATPRSALGFICAALDRRRLAGAGPFTVMSCDNLPSNGVLARGMVIAFAKRISTELAAWIEAEVPFPATMVDRITPATTPENVDRLARAEGYEDPAMVVHEPFRQWVIEDDFAAGRPAWDSSGAQFVQSVEAHELMKLRMLNGTHSTLAYLGYLGGYETISETVADPAYAALCDRLWRDEIIPTVPQPVGEDLVAYADALLERYRNPAIRHRTWQIAMDGSQKLPQRLLGTIRVHLDRGHVPEGLCLAVAAWMRYVGGVDEAGEAIAVRDPLAGRLKAASDAAASPQDRVAALLGFHEVFDPDLAGVLRFRQSVETAYQQLLVAGAREAVRRYVA